MALAVDGLDDLQCFEDGSSIDGGFVISVGEEVCPPVQPCVFGSLRYDTLLWTLRTMLLFAYKRMASGWVVT